jgi:hypothetical protein
MKNSKLMVMSAFVLLIATAAFAQTPEASILPVTEPLEVGGTILQPGTYLIRVLPSTTDRNKVQITSQDRSTVYATVLTVPHQLEPNEEVPNTMFVYYPAGEGAPRALRTWFAAYPEASQGGHDIVYEESRAKQLARLARGNVVSFAGETTIAELDTTPLHVVTPEERIETYTYIAPTVPAPAPVIIAETTPAPMVSSTEVEMPATASNLPLMALLGLIAIAGAIALRVRG